MLNLSADIPATYYLLYYPPVFFVDCMLCGVCGVVGGAYYLVFSPIGLSSGLHREELSPKENPRQDQQGPLTLSPTIYTAPVPQVTPGLHETPGLWGFVSNCANTICSPPYLSYELPMKPLSANQSGVTTFIKGVFIISRLIRQIPGMPIGHSNSRPGIGLCLGALIIQAILAG